MFGVTRVFGMRWMNEIVNSVLKRTQITIWEAKR